MTLRIGTDDEPGLPAANAIEEAARSIGTDLRVAEVVEMDVLIENGTIGREGMSGLPVVLAGEATFAGYTILGDTSISEKRFKGDGAAKTTLSIIGESHGRRVRMAHAW